MQNFGRQIRCIMSNDFARTKPETELYVSLRIVKDGTLHRNRNSHSRKLPFIIERECIPDINVKLERFDTVII